MRKVSKELWVEQVEFPGRAFQTDEMAQVKTWKSERPSDVVMVQGDFRVVEPRGETIAEKGGEG